MRKRLLIFAGLLSMTIAVSMNAAAPMMMTMEMGIAEQVELEKMISLSVEGNVVQVTGATGMVLEVVSLTGRQVATYKIDSPAQRIELSVPKGCYILKVGKVVRKVTIH